MNRTIRLAIRWLFLLGALSALCYFLATQSMTVLSPKGMIALKQRDLFVDATLLMCIVVIPVFVLTIAFAWKYRAGNHRAKHSPDLDYNLWAECLWWGIPCLIILVLGVITWRSSHELSPYRPIETGKKPLTIQAVALQWKWLFLYPEQEIATVNFIQFPVDTPLHFEITSDAPMNSFWIPALGGQIYAMPAMKTELYLIANEQGSFRGSSANISGVGFAGMTFTAESTSEEKFEAWIQSARQADGAIDWNEYLQLVQPSEKNPPATYRLQDRELFQQILRQYQGMAHVR